MTVKHRARAACACALAFLLASVAGCGPIIPGVQSPAPDLYRLTPKSTFNEELPEHDIQLVVETPVAAASLDTARIAVRRNPMTLEYYERALWADVAPKMVQLLMVESFENTGKIISVGRETVGLRSDFVLKLELREFQAEVATGEAQAHVRLIAKLVEMPERRIIAFTSEDHLVPAASTSLEDVVIAFDDALGRALKRVVSWTMATIPR